MRQSEESVAFLGTNEKNQAYGKPVPPKRNLKLQFMFIAMFFLLLSGNYTVNLSLETWSIRIFNTTSFTDYAAGATSFSAVVSMIIILCFGDNIGRFSLYSMLIVQSILLSSILILAKILREQAFWYLIVLFFLQQTLLTFNQFLIQRIVVAFGEHYLSFALLSLPFSGICQWIFHSILNKKTSPTTYINTVYIVATLMTATVLALVWAVEARKEGNLYEVKKTVTHTSELTLSYWDSVKMSIRFSYPSFISIFITMSSLSILYPIIIQKITENAEKLDFMVLTGLVQVGELFGRAIFWFDRTTLKQVTSMWVSVVRAIIFLPLYVMIAKADRESFLRLPYIVYPIHLFFAFTFGWLLTCGFITSTSESNLKKVKQTCGDIALASVTSAIFLSTWAGKLILKPLI